MGFARQMLGSFFSSDADDDETFEAREPRKSMTFGVMPASEVWDDHWAAFVGRGNGYKMNLGRSDSKAANKVGWPDPMRNGRYSSAQMYAFVQRLANEGDDDTDSMASDIMGTLGFEWI